MENKLFEVRDRATCIPMLAIHIDGEVEDQEDWLLRRAGYGKKEERNYVYLVHLQTGEGNYDAFKWNDSRTIREAHLYINKYWSELKSGEVLDIEYILGESKQKKTSDRYYI